MKRLLGLVRDDMGLKMVALLLAVVLWAYLAGEKMMTRDIAIPLQLKNIPAGTLLVGEIESNVKVTARGAPSVMMSLTKDDFIAELDLAKCDSSGLCLINPRVRPTTESVQLVTFSPLEVSIRLELVE
jgi:hypothetical protein